MKTTFEIIPPISKNSYHLLEMIEYVVCKRCGIDAKLLTLRIKKQRIADARHLYAHFCYLYTDVTLDEIGKTINRSPPTIRDSFLIIQYRITHQDRTVYSLYLKIKWDLDDFIKSVHPTSYENRIARIQQVDRADLLL